MHPLSFTTNVNANATAEEEEWAKNLPNRKHGEPKPKQLNKSDLDYADDCYFAGLLDKEE